MAFMARINFYGTVLHFLSALPGSKHSGDRAPDDHFQAQSFYDVLSEVHYLNIRRNGVSSLAY